MMEGLRTPTELVMRVIILLAYGCPTQAIVHAYRVDERSQQQISLDKRECLQVSFVLMDNLLFVVASRFWLSNKI
jgi:hypothetical protein